MAPSVFGANYSPKLAIMHICSLLNIHKRKTVVNTPSFIFLKKNLLDDARGNQPGIVNGIPLVDGGAADIVEFRAFPGQGRGRALAA